MSNAINTLLCYLGALYHGPVAVGARFAVVHHVRAISNTPERWNCKGACKRCGAKTSLLGVWGIVTMLVRGSVEAVVTADGRAYQIDNGRVIVPCRGCGVGRYATRIVGKYNAGKACNAKCQAACGPSCECRCKGLNHGASVSL